MNSIATRGAPFIALFLIDDGVSALEIIWIFEEGIVFVSDIVTSDLLLYNSLAPVIIKPWLRNLLLTGGRTQ